MGPPSSASTPPHALCRSDVRLQGQYIGAQGAFEEHSLHRPPHKQMFGLDKHTLSWAAAGRTWSFAWVTPTPHAVRRISLCFPHEAYHLTSSRQAPRRFSARDVLTQYESLSNPLEGFWVKTPPMLPVVRKHQNTGTPRGGLFSDYFMYTTGSALRGASRFRPTSLLTPVFFWTVPRKTRRGRIEGQRKAPVKSSTRTLPGVARRR